MVEDASSPDGPATKAQLDAWIKSRNITFPMTIDKPDTPFLMKKTLGIRETSYVVELSTMKILKRVPAGQYKTGLTFIDSLP
jgi:hypothetical protein